MTETPIIDTAAKAVMECDEESAWDSIASADCRKAAIAALRTALPWDLPAERLEAMARAMVVQTAVHYGDVLPVNPDLRLTKELAIAAYRADTIMRELYDENGEPR